MHAVQTKNQMQTTGAAEKLYGSLTRVNVVFPLQQGSIVL